MDGLFIGGENKYIDQVKGISILSLLARTDNIEIMFYEFVADRPVSIIPGDSRDLLEFYYITEGSIVIDLGDCCYTLNKGDYFYVHNISQTVPFRTLTETKILYITSAPVYNFVYNYTEDLNQLLSKSESKDIYMRKHGNRVQDYSVKIANKLGLSTDIHYALAMASLFHDIGKCFIPDEILNKPSSLTDNEFNYIKKHSTYSSELMQGKFKEEVSCIVEQHHERLDGSGYPKGLKGDQIRTEAKIIAVADSYDAMTSDRAYRKARSPEAAVNELKRCIGIYYDEKIVLALEEILREEGVLSN